MSVHVEDYKKFESIGLVYTVTLIWITFALELHLPVDCIRSSANLFQQINNCRVEEAKVILKCT